MGMRMTFRAVIKPCTQSAHAPEAMETANGTATTPMYTGLLKIEFVGWITPVTTAKADRNVTSIQLKPENGPRSISSSPTFFGMLTSLAVAIVLQYFAMHLHHPCEVLATCFFHASRVEGSSLIIFTLLRYIPRFPAR